MSSPPPLALYVHWPFCKSKCPYCDFNSYVRASVDEDDWKQALLRELDYWGEQTRGREIHSIFFGGGTPSLMPPRLTEALIERTSHWWKWKNDIEITLEANPTSVETEKLSNFKQAGVNRLSLGIQALNDHDLKALGRQHNATEALTALDMAKSHFERISFDLIYAREGQTVTAWEQELTRAIGFSASHMSLYQLTIEENTRFASLYAQGNLALPDEILSSDLYDLTQEITSAAGLHAYEISNHTRIGEECRHNLIYWRYDDYIGIGPGAHGRITLNGKKHATINLRTPEAWSNQVRKNGTGMEENNPTALSAEDQQMECLLMGLRLNEGIPLSKLQSLGFPIQSGKIEHLRNLGLLTHQTEKLQATPEGRLRLNALISSILL